MLHSRYLTKIKSLWQNTRTRRLLLALTFSSVLHLFLIGQFDFLAFKPQPHLIEAQLLAKPMPNIAQKQTPLEQPAIKSDHQTPQKEKLATDEVASTHPAQTAPHEPSQSTSDNIEKAYEPLSSPQDKAATLAEELSAEAKLAPYTYIESEFDVYTELESQSKRAPAGSARIVYQRTPDGQQYQLKSLMQANGLISLILPDLLQTSEGHLTDAGLQPSHYLYQFGNKKDKTYRAYFDWNNKKLSLQTASGEETLDLQTGTQDLLSFMYQFMFAPPLHTMQLSITNGKKLGMYDYIFVGETSISTAIKNLNTYHLERISEEGEKKTELWLALDYQYLPVKIRETDKHGKVYELVIKKLITQSAPSPSP